jgi:hypothetical protein
MKEGVLVADELSVLQKERERHVKDIEKIDGKIEELTAARRQELLDELKALGWKATGKRKTGEREKKDAPCTVCGFKTEPLHDARKHRSQGKSKKAFNAEELKELGLKKVG